MHSSDVLWLFLTCIADKYCIITTCIYTQAHTNIPSTIAELSRQIEVFVLNIHQILDNTTHQLDVGYTLIQTIQYILAVVYKLTSTL